jgi:NAD(P)-dependent dehydrogenase (short-subunit alcohol dehydrogenase family)
MSTSDKTTVVTGAGSGVGRAVTIQLARENWNVVAVGRTQQTLDETVKLASKLVVAHVCDVSDAKQVQSLAQRVERDFGGATVLVNSAGANVPRRFLSELSLDDYHKLIAIDLNGAFYCVHAFLPMMRLAGGGTIVNINSVAGLRANPVSGAAYTAAKFGLRGLTQTINIEECRHGIRACDIFPGEIDTPLIDKRPKPPTPEQRAKMLHAEDVAACVMLVVNLPPRAVVQEITIRPGNSQI